MLPLLGSYSHLSYNSIIDMMGLQLLKERRDLLSKTFAKKMFKHPEHRKMFSLINGERWTITDRKVIVPKAKTKRYENSSIPSLANIINMQS